MHQQCRRAGELQKQPVTPDRAPRPRADPVRDASEELVRFPLLDVLDEFRRGEEVPEDDGDLQVYAGGFEAVGCRWGVGAGEGVGEHVGRVGDVGLARAELEGEDLAAANEGEEAAAGGCTGAPVCDGEGWRDGGGYGEGGAGPGEEGFALGKTPVGCAVELEDAEGGEGRFGGDKGGDGGRGGDLLIEKGDSNEGAAEGREEAERGDCAGEVAGGGEADEGAAAGVEVLGG